MLNTSELAQQIMSLHQRAYGEYLPLVEDICARQASEDEVELLLDYLLDFCGEKHCLELFKKVCRHYYPIHPRAIAFEINSYREFYEEEK